MERQARSYEDIFDGSCGLRYVRDLMGGFSPLVSGAGSHSGWKLRRWLLSVKIWVVTTVLDRQSELIVSYSARFS